MASFSTTSPSSSSPSPTVIAIVGAGAAGLGAARWLLDNDLGGALQVVVIEARERIGGRVHTETQEFGIPIDLGGAWLHSHKEGSLHPMSVIASHLGLKLSNTDFTNGTPFDLQGCRLSDDEASSHWATLEKAFITATRKRSGGETRSLEELIKIEVGEKVWNRPIFQSLLCDYDFEFGTSLKNVSAFAVDKNWIQHVEVEEEEEDLNMCFPDTGYGAVLQALVTGMGNSFFFL